MSSRVSMTPAGNQTIPSDVYKFHGVEQMRVELLPIVHHEHMRCIMNIHDSSWRQMLRRGYSLSVMSTRNASQVFWVFWTHDEFHNGS